MKIETNVGKIHIREGEDTDGREFVRITLQPNIGVKTTNNMKVFDMVEEVVKVSDPNEKEE